MTLTKIPRANHPMIPSLFLLDYILYQGKNSILNQELVFKKKMCYSVGGGTYVRRMPSSFIFQFIPAPGIKPENVVKQWKKILRELKERKNLNQLIEKSRRFLLTGFYKDLETVEGISETIGWGTVLGSPDTLFDIYRKIDKLQTGDIRKAIDFILESPSATFTVKPGKGEKS
jgi:predicted Zn-dependent peptidase